MTPPSIRTGTAYLACELTEAELRRYGDDLAGVVQDLAAEVDRQADLKAQMKARTTELEARKSQLAIAISRREEMRDVPIEICADFERRMEIRTRTDTGEVIGTRELTDDEMQRPLPGVAE